MRESWGNHRGIEGELVKHCQPSHQHPQQAILGDCIRLAVTAIQLAVKNLPCEADVKAQVGSSMI